MTTTGYEDLTISNVPKHLSFENLSKKGKRIALIAAPVEFDARSLQSEILIQNGISTLNKNLREDGNDGAIEDENYPFSWNVHSETTLNTKYNILFPCTTQTCHKIALPATWNVNVVQSLNLPNIKYSRKSRKTKKLAKPEGLRVRWIPFGADPPFIHSKEKSRKPSDKATVIDDEDDDKSNKRKKKRKREIEESPSTVETYSWPTAVKHKKRKKKSESSEVCSETNNSSKFDEKHPNEEHQESDTTESKKKKKKKEKNIDKIRIQDSSDAEETVNVKKKKKTNKK